METTTQDLGQGCYIWGEELSGYFVEGHVEPDILASRLDAYCKDADNGFGMRLTGEPRHRYFKETDAPDPEEIAMEFSDVPLDGYRPVTYAEAEEYELED